MKKQLQYIFGLLPVLLAAGCSTGSDGIEFVSDAQLKPAGAPAVMPNAP